MKFLLLVLLSLSSTLAFASARVVDLNGKYVGIGALQSEIGSIGSEDITVVRSSLTPKVVHFNFVLKKQEQVCVNYQTYEYWVAPRQVYVCHDVYFPHVSREHRGRRVRDEGGHFQRICQYVWQAGYYETQTRCERYAWKTFAYDRKIRLNFTDAKRLRGTEKESFVLSLRQKDMRTLDFHYSAVTKESKTSYRVKKYNFFVRLFVDGLNFIAR